MWVKGLGRLVRAVTTLRLVALFVLEELPLNLGSSTVDRRAAIGCTLGRDERVAATGVQDDLTDRLVTFNVEDDLALLQVLAEVFKIRHLALRIIAEGRRDGIVLERDAEFHRSFTGFPGWVATFQSRLSWSSKTGPLAGFNRGLPLNRPRRMKKGGDG